MFLIEKRQNKGNNIFILLKLIKTNSSYYTFFYAICQ